jgi:hypothetical protein
MDWRSLGTLQVSPSGGAAQRLLLPVATPLLRVRAIILNAEQVHYRKVGYLRLLTLTGDEAFSSVLLQQARIIEVPKWLDLFRVEVSPVPYLINAQIEIEGLEASSVAQFDYVEIPLDIQTI